MPVKLLLHQDLSSCYSSKGIGNHVYLKFQEGRHLKTNNPTNTTFNGSDEKKDQVNNAFFCPPLKKISLRLLSLDSFVACLEKYIFEGIGRERESKEERKTFLSINKDNNKFRGWKTNYEGKYLVQ